jgi:hypothetical protein
LRGNRERDWEAVVITLVIERVSSGKIEEYHCWTEFYLPGVGWFPIDASEAWKHKERRDLYFGTHPADRIQFTVGRDLELGEGHTTAASTTSSTLIWRWQVSN